jgi:hypothetical protein
MPTCAPATLSRCVGCGALWHPIATGHCSAAARHCSTQDTRARSSTAPPASLAKLTRPKAHCLEPGVALEARARSRVAWVRWHDRVCRMAASVHLLSSSPPRQRRMDKCPPRCLHARRCHCDVAATPCCACEHARSATAPSRHLLLSLCVGCVAPMQCAAIKEDLPRAFCPRPDCCLPPVSQATSPDLSPRAQVSKLRKASELLPDQLKSHLLRR